MTLSLWNLAAYTIQLAALVAVALTAAWALGLRIPRHALRFWQAIMAMALLLPLAQQQTADPAGFRLLAQFTSGTSQATAGPIAPAGIDVATIVLAIIAAGIVGRLLWLAIGLIRLRSIVAGSESGDALAPLAAELSHSLNVNAEVRVSDDLESPATIGVRRPLVLVPRSALQMPESVQRAILCHELVHVKRRDWLQTIGEELWCALLWFNPFARVMASRLSLARETMVDEMTILITRDRRAYAQALLAFADPQPHVIGVTPFIGRHTLSQRISLIAEEVSMSRRRAISGLALAFVACLGTAAVMVDRFPMFTLLAQSKVYDPGDGVTLPVVVHEVKPGYTAEAMQQKIQGSVWMKVVIGATGDVTGVQISRSLDAEFGLDRKAMEAAYQWKFKPGTKDGVPVAVRVTVEMTFTLKK